jgi:hypothetical protein
VTEQDDNRLEDAQIEPSLTVIRKAFVVKMEPRRSGMAKAVVSPDAAARLLSFASGVTSRTETSYPTVKRDIIRKPRRRVPVVFTQKEAYKTEGPHEMEVRRQVRPMLREKTEVQATSDLVDTAPIKQEDTRISTEGLSRFALEELPENGFEQKGKRGRPSVIESLGDPHLPLKAAVLRNTAEPPLNGLLRCTKKKMRARSTRRPITRCPKRMTQSMRLKIPSGLNYQWRREFWTVCPKRSRSSFLS